MFAIHRQIKLLYVLFSLCVLCKKGLEFDTITIAHSILGAPKPPSYSIKKEFEGGFALPAFCTATFILGQHRTIRQEVSDRIFAPIQSSENGGILYVFPIFGTAEVEQKDG